MVLTVNLLYWTLKKSFQMFFFTTIIIHFFFQTTVLKELSNPLICFNIEGHKFISASLDVSCEDEKYKKWVNYL